MPDIALAQQIYLGGVITAFLTFMAVVGGGYLYVNSAPRQRLESAAVEDAEPAWALERQAA